MNLSNFSDDELIALLTDDTGELRRRLRGVQGIGEVNVEFSSENITQEMLAGSLSLAMYRKGSGHNDPNWGRLAASSGGQNLGYFETKDVTGLFHPGQNSIALEVWRPWWIGIGKITYHSRVELRSVNRVVCWVEAWGWYGIGTESKLYGHQFNVSA